MDNLVLFKTLSKQYGTPSKVQRLLRTFKYNKLATLYSARTAWKRKSAHCMEGALLAAAILEHVGFPPLILSFESIDKLEHVLFVYKKRNRWGAIGISRDLGLRGRKPVFRSIRDLVWSYYKPYIDLTGRISAYQLVNLEDTGSDWRFSKQNVWKAENYLLRLPHKKLKSSDQVYRKIRKAFIKNGAIPPLSCWDY